MSLIQIAQDSAAVILYECTPPAINILYTKDLESCTAVVVKGEKGIALIHDGGKLTESSLANVLKKIGNIEFWATVCNSHYNPPAEFQSFFRDNNFKEVNFSRIRRALEILNAAQKYKGEQLGICAGIDRAGNIYCSESALPPHTPVKQLDLTLRIQTEILRNGWHTYGQQYYDCSLQYDGTKFLPIRKLPKIDKALQAAEQQNPTYKAIGIAYRKAKEEFDKYNAMVEGVVEKYTADSHEQALRRAADVGDAEDIQILCRLTRVNVDAQGEKTGQTALHYAALKKHKEAIDKLKEFGAKDDIPDHLGVTAGSILTANPSR